MTVPTNADCETLNRRYGAPERIVFRPSKHDAPVVVLSYLSVIYVSYKWYKAYFRGDRQ